VLKELGHCSNTRISVEGRMAKEIWMCQLVEREGWERFGKDVGHVQVGGDVSESNKTGGDSFPNAHDLAGKMFLLDLRGW